MKQRGPKSVIALSFLILIGFSIPAHSETEGVKQEELGKAILQSALLKQQESGDIGAVQERLGKAIQEAARSSSRMTVQDGTLQERLGHEIQDAAVLQYAQGRTQERMGETLLQMAKS